MHTTAARLHRRHARRWSARRHTGGWTAGRHSRRKGWSRRAGGWCTRWSTVWHHDRNVSVVMFYTPTAGVTLVLNTTAYFHLSTLVLGDEVAKKLLVCFLVAVIASALKDMTDAMLVDLRLTVVVKWVRHLFPLLS